MRRHQDVPADGIAQAEVALRQRHQADTGDLRGAVNQLLFEPAFIFCAAVMNSPVQIVGTRTQVSNVADSTESRVALSNMTPPSSAAACTGYRIAAMLAWPDCCGGRLAKTMRNRRGLFIVLVMIFSAGVTPIVIRITQSEGMPSLVIVWIRLWLVSIGLAPLVWTRYRQDLVRLTKRQILLSFVAGFWLSLNLLLLFAALEYTSVLMTSVLRRTTPMWIVLPEIILFGVVFSRRFWLSLVVTLVGVTMVGFGGLSAVEAGSDPLLGAAMALCGSLCFGAYLLIGRQLNNLIPPLLYSFLVFFSSALVTSSFVIVTGTPSSAIRSTATSGR